MAEETVMHRDFILGEKKLVEEKLDAVLFSGKQLDEIRGQIQDLARVMYHVGYMFGQGEMLEIWSPAIREHMEKQAANKHPVDQRLDP